MINIAAVAGFFNGKICWQTLKFFGIMQLYPKVNMRLLGQGQALLRASLIRCSCRSLFVFSRWFVLFNCIFFFTQRQNDGNDGGYCRLRKHECGWVWETSRKQSHVFKNALNFPSYPTTLYFVDCMLTTILHNCCQSHLVSDFTCTYDRSEKLLHPIQTRPNQTCIVCSISFL